MISSKAKNPNCMYMWMNHIISPKANAAVAEWFGEAPANARRAPRPRARTTARPSTPTTRRTSTRSRTGRRRRRTAATTAATVCKDYSEWVQPGRRSRADAGPHQGHRCSGRSDATSARRLAGPAPRLSLGCCAGAARLAGHRLPRLARGPVRRGVLDARPVHRARSSTSTASQNFETIVERRGLPRRSSCGRSRSPRGDDHRHRCSPSRSRSTWRKVASPRVRGAARRRRADAAVVELPGEGLRVAHDPRRGRDPQLGARAVRAERPGLGNVATWLVFTYLWLPFMILPIYAGLERIPDSLLDASGDLGASAVDDLPPRRPAARVPGGRRRLDLHVLADARRLHHAAARLEHAVHRQRRLRERRRREQPAARGGVRDGPGGVMIIYLLIARRLGAFENLYARRCTSHAGTRHRCCASAPASRWRSSTSR